MTGPGQQPAVLAMGEYVAVSGRVAAWLAEAAIVKGRRLSFQGSAMPTEVAEAVGLLFEAGRTWRERGMSPPGHRGQFPGLDVSPSEGAYLSAADAAKRLGIGERQVRRLCSSRVLPGRLVGGAYVIDVDDVTELKYERDRRGKTR